jgi:SAM-dependent methyltransferase
MTKSVRMPHAALNLKSRWPKAEKIRRLLSLREPVGRPLRLLEIGCGAGAIAHYFAANASTPCVVDAVDVVDQRQVTDGYKFSLVEGTWLPFDDSTFDAVVSNHVIEHVGDHKDQLEHLCQIARVLRDDGVLYLAMPSRWQVVEPHYHLAFLSWIPKKWRSSYLRATGKGEFYDCEPLEMSVLEKLLDEAGFSCRNVFADALEFFVVHEGSQSMFARIANCLPSGVVHALRGISPTHAYIARPKNVRVPST